VLNAMLLLAPGQAPQWTAKRGLTPSEVRFFSPPVLGEVGHPGQLLFQGRRFGVVFCREILDPLEHLAGADALLWPGCIQWDEDDNYERAASAHCLRLGVPLLQANWADAINAPQISGMGGSFLLDTQGAVFRRAALDSADLLTLEFFWRQTP
jgi:predicted amidohydrolase